MVNTEDWQRQFNLQIRVPEEKNKAAKERSGYENQ